MRHCSVPDVRLRAQTEEEMKRQVKHWVTPYRVEQETGENWKVKVRGFGTDAFPGCLWSESLLNVQVKKRCVHQPDRRTVVLQGENEMSKGCNAFWVSGFADLGQVLTKHLLIARGPRMPALALAVCGQKSCACSPAEKLIHEVQIEGARQVEITRTKLHCIKQVTTRGPGGYHHYHPPLSGGISGGGSPPGISVWFHPPIPP